MFEPPESGHPTGLLASLCLLKVVRGTVWVPVVNVGTSEVLRYPRIDLGSLSAAQVVSLPVGVTEVGATVATVSTQTATPSAIDRMASLDLSALTGADQEKVRSLLQKFSSVFAAHDGDLGCTNLLSNDIPLLDDEPVRQRYRRTPPPQSMRR